MASSTERAADGFFSIYNPQSEIYYNLNSREIRLVKLHRGQWSDKICCQLYHVSLANRPVYKALSYAWGSPRATRLILVNGHQHPVTVNLESALRRLRSIDLDISFWIDALCINQSNNSERTEQVNLMHDIFASTEEVIVYLGEVPRHDSSTLQSISTSNKTFHCDDRDGESLELFRSHSKMKCRARLDYAFEIFCPLRLLFGEADSNELPAFEPTSRRFIGSKYQRNILEELRQLMRSRWWSTIWVIQEVVVPKNVTMVYGSASAPWNMFVNAARWDLRNRSSSTPLEFPHEDSIVLARFSRIILDIERMRELWRDGQQTHLLPLLRRFSGRKASDDRDKVFALLSLTRDRTFVIPNYSLSVPAVLQMTVLDIIKTTKSLAPLAGDLGSKDRQDLPSWVPDWSATYDDLDRRRADNTANYSTTGCSHVYVQDKGAREWNGIRQYLSDIGGYYDLIE